MSLLSESVETVLESQQAQSIELVLPPTLNPPISSGFYKQKVGIASPRGENTVVLVYDVQTNAPLQLPPNSIPMVAYVSPVIPLSSANPATSDIQIAFVKNLNNLNDYILYNDPYNLNEVNNKYCSELLDGYGVGQPEYVYAALLCSKTLPAITVGTVKIIYQYV